MVAVGLPTDPTVVAGAPPLLLALRRLNVVGSVTGTLKDVEECLDFTARGLVKVRTSLLDLRAGGERRSLCASQSSQKGLWRTLKSFVV